MLHNLCRHCPDLAMIERGKGCETGDDIDTLIQTFLDGASAPVFAMDLSRWPRCGGSRKVIAAITDSGVIAYILE
jgi:hypothetical protein